MSSKRKKNVFPAKGIPSKPVAAASPGPPAGAGSRWAILGVCVFLAAAVWIVFGQALHFKFINYDDNEYVYENAGIVHGLSWRGLGWIFTHSVSSNWHPLTMLSHMLDCQFYGVLNAGGHHLTNVLLHTASVILLFLVLRDMTGARWRSAFVAAVFAVHPLHVESVAWVSERKDVLSGLFFMLTIWAYVRYVRRLSWGNYLLVVLAFVLGLMCKPMLVTVPFVLLLLDYWPLNRIRNSEFGIRNFTSLVREKIPLLGLAAVFCVVTMLTQTGAINSTQPLSQRLANALASYFIYLGQMFWPARLAVHYPPQEHGLSPGEIITAALVLAAISAAAWVARRKHPCLLVGWLWYLGMLVPVIGLVQVGEQAHADRYTYLPQIGLYLMLAWLVADLSVRLRHRFVALAGLAVIILAALIFCARAQASYWQDSETLWTHTLAVTDNNNVAHDNLACALAEKGQVAEAIVHWQKALAINPDYAEAHNNLGNTLLQKGLVDEAVVQLQQALAIKPDFAEAHNNLGNALLQKGQTDEAILHYRQALALQPDYADAHYNLGNALLQTGRVDEAVVQFQKALAIKPGYAEAHITIWATLLFKKDKPTRRFCTINRRWPSGLTTPMPISTWATRCFKPGGWTR
jgi:tetratricopeptide (TPR) repeat protein